MTQTQEEHDMFRNKPTVGSVCEGMCRALPFASVSPERHKAQTTISGCSFTLFQTPKELIHSQSRFFVHSLHALQFFQLRYSHSI